MAFLPVLLPLLLACGEDEDVSGASDEDAVQASAPKLERLDRPTGATSGSEERAQDEDSMAELVAELDNLPAGADADLDLMLDARERTRRAEDQRIHSAALNVVTAFTGSCKRADVEPAFATLVELESESSSNDRRAYVDVLSKVSADGRKSMWGIDDFERTL